MTFKIPLFDLNFGEEESKAILDVLRSKWISLGPRNVDFENKFKIMTGSNHALALSNCTNALHLALNVLGIKEDDEVIVPSLTFVATVNVIRYVNAVPVFCDIKSLDDLTLDPEHVETLISKKTKAIIIMHYAGFPCDMDRIMEIAAKYNLKVIEDACHAPLSEYNGKKLGTIGDIGCFSFFSNKNISTGEGGMLITDDPEYYNNAKLLRSHGMTTMSYERAKGHSTQYDVIALGYNYRMDDIRAAIGMAQLGKLQKDLDKRTEIRKYYIEKLSKLKEVIIPFKKHTQFTSNYIFPIILKDSDSLRRDGIRDDLLNFGIQTSVHYPAVHLFSIYREYHAQLPNTEYASDNEITLPMYSKLESYQIDEIADCLERALSYGGK